MAGSIDRLPPNNPARVADTGLSIDPCELLCSLVAVGEYY